MKLSCTRDNLHRGLSITSHLMTKNVNLPILQNVLMKADGGVIRFTSTNLEVAVHCVVRGKVDEPGEHTLPSKLFFDYVSLLPNEIIHLETQDDHIHVACAGYKTKINGLNASEFPLIPKIHGQRMIEIPVDDFKNALAQVLFSVASNESRPELTGVSMHFWTLEREGRLTLASTDSYRLSEKVIPVVSGVDEDLLIVVPAKTLAEISRILSVFKEEADLPSTIAMHLSNSQVIFVYGGVELISRTIDEKYPDYEQIIPKNFQTKAVLDRDDFMKSVKTASLFSKTGLFDITLEFDPEKKVVRVSSTDATRGANISECPGEITGPSNSVTVNFRYLLDGLQAIRSQQVLFEMIDASNPCLLTGLNAQEAFRYVVMPIKQ